jgi:type I restriction enzyme S subunit
VTAVLPKSSREWSFGPIPSGWRAVPLKYLCTRTSLYGANIAADLYSDDGIRFLRTTDIREDGTLSRTGVCVPAEAVRDYMLVPGDFLISRSGTVGRAYVYREEDGPCSYAGYLVRYALRERETPRWLYYITKTPGFLQWLGTAAVESTISNVNGDKYANLLVPVPPPEKQHAIVAYLDRETARLDALVRAKERMLALFSEKRMAVISHVVTRGLNANAPSKPSGIEWLATIPAHWNIVGLTKFLASLVDYRGRTPTKVDEGVLLVTARNIRSGNIDYEASAEFIDPSEYEATMSRGKPQIGDVLFTTEAPLGEVANVDRTDIALAQRIIKFRGDPAIIDNYFLKFWLLGQFAQADMARLATGSTAVGIKGSKVGQLRLVLPPLQEQRAIVEYLSQAIEKSDAIAAATERSITLLKERRVALISAAVTGALKIA